MPGVTVSVSQRVWLYMRCGACPRRTRTFLEHFGPELSYVSYYRVPVWAMGKVLGQSHFVYS